MKITRIALLKLDCVSILMLLAMAFGAFNLAQLTARDALAQKQKDNCPCGTCTSGWIYDSTYMGGVECQHGPLQKNNPGCTACYGAAGIINFNCCEYRAGKPCWTPNAGVAAPVWPRDYTNNVVPNCNAAGACQCFKCKANSPCEGVFRSWSANCGVQADKKYNPVICKLVPLDGTTEALAQSIDTLPPTGPNGCNAPNVAGGLVTYYVCGQLGGAGGNNSMGEIKAAKCVANNCEEDPNGTWEDQLGDSGIRMKCG